VCPKHLVVCKAKALAFFFLSASEKDAAPFQKRRPGLARRFFLFSFLKKIEFKNVGATGISIQAFLLCGFRSQRRFSLFAHLKICFRAFLKSLPIATRPRV
jgi:hypothetical protein